MDCSPFDANPDHPFENESIGLEDCTSFEEVYKILKGKVLPDEFKPRTGTEIIRHIEELRSGSRELCDLTRTFGVRAAVSRLLEAGDARYRRAGKRKAKKHTKLAKRAAKKGIPLEV